MMLDTLTNEELIRHFLSSTDENIRLLCRRLEGKGDAQHEELAELRHEASYQEEMAEKAEGKLYDIAEIIAGDESDKEKLADIARILP